MRNQAVSVASVVTNLKVRTKITVGFSLVLVILAVTGGMGLHALIRIGEGNDLMAHSTDVVGIGRDIALRFAYAQRFVQEFAETGDSATAAQAEAALAQVKEAVDRALATLVKPERQAQAREIAEAVAGYAKNLAHMKTIRADLRISDRDVYEISGTKAHVDLGNFAAAAGRAGNTSAQLLGLAAVEAVIDARLNAEKLRRPHTEAQTQKTTAKFALLDKALRAIELVAQNPELKPHYDDAMAAIGKYRDAFQRSLAILGETDTLIKGEMTSEVKLIVADAELIMQGAKGYQARAQSAIHTTIATSQTISLALIAAGLLLGAAFAWFTGSAIAGPVVGMTAAMRKLAEGDTEVTVPGVGRKDEIGAMAGTLHVFKDNRIAADRLAAEQEAEQKVKAQRAERLEGLTQSFERTAGELVGMVSSAATELQATAHSMTSIAGQTTRQATTVAAAAEEASVNVQTVASAAEELAASIGEISRQVAQSAKIAGKAVEDAKRTDGVVRALAEGAQKIGEVVGLISNIAGQTNLLALNATIEAARAGDGGKGFAVVASEVKSLATQTAKATDDIARQIAQIQIATKEAVESIQGIGATIGEVSEIAAAIAAAVEEQGSATQEIARNVQQAAIGTTEVTSTIGGVSEGASSTGAAATQVLGAAAELSKQSERLSGEVGRFIAGVKAA